MLLCTVGVIVLNWVPFILQPLGTFKGTTNLTPHKNTGSISRVLLCGGCLCATVARALTRDQYPLSFFKFNWQAWLTEKDGGKQEGDAATSMAFSRSAPFKVRSVMARTQTLPDEQGDSSHKPSFYICCRTQQRLKADILMLSKKCDYRLFVKTSKKFKRMHYRSQNLNHKVLTIAEFILFNISYEKISRQIK